MLAGLSADRSSMINTVLAAALGGLLGIMIAPLTQLDPSQMTLLVIPALAAALLARFTSFGLACGFGLGIGVLQSLVFYAQTQSWFPTAAGQPLPGMSQVLVFVIVIIAMLWRGKTLPTRGIVTQKLPPAPAARRRLLPAAVVLVATSVLLIVLPFDFRQALTLSIIGVTIALSLTVITGFVGQVSLLPPALAGIAGLVLSRLAVQLGLGFPVGPVIAVCAAVVVGCSPRSPRSASAVCSWRW